MGLVAALVVLLLGMFFVGVGSYAVVRLRSAAGVSGEVALGKGIALASPAAAIGLVLLGVMELVLATLYLVGRP